MVALGAACLIATTPVALYAVFAALAGRRGDRRWVDSSRRAIYALCALLTISVVVLEASFLRRRLLGRARRRPLLDDDAGRLQADRDVV